MKKLFIFLCILFLIGNIMYAQQTDSLRYKYTNQTIYRYGGWFIKGTDRLTFQDLRGEFSSSELGLAGYDKARKYRTTSKVLRYVSMLSVFAIAPFINGNNRNAAYTFIGANLVLGYASGHYSNLSNQSLDRALWQRNKDVLFPGR